MSAPISISTKKVYETEDGCTYDTWHAASEHLLFLDVHQFVSTRCDYETNKPDMIKIIMEYWPELSTAFEAHNKRLTDGAPQS